MTVLPMPLHQAPTKDTPVGRPEACVGHRAVCDKVHQQRVSFRHNPLRCDVATVSTNQRRVAHTEAIVNGYIVKSAAY